MSTEGATCWWRTRAGTVATGFALVVTVYILPYGILLLCRLTHLIMHHDHGDAVPHASRSSTG
ncbi:MAG: DUF2933 domain-containing protein [Rubritepida sp.]|nr:DUF2933 domain-containing protein [Rubritepida sp.]